MRRSLPALTRFSFEGVREYLEDFVAQTDAPQLNACACLLYNLLQPTHFRHSASFSHSSSVTYRSSSHHMKHGSCSTVASLKSRFPLQNGDLDTKRLHWESQAERLIGSFRLSPSSVGRPRLLLPRGTPLHLLGWKYVTALAKKLHREFPMAGSYAYHCAEPLPPEEAFTTYRARPARARRGKDDRTVTHLQSFLGSSAIRTCPRSHFGLLRRTTASRTPFSC